MCHILIVPQRLDRVSPAWKEAPLALFRPPSMTSLINPSKALHVAHQPESSNLAAATAHTHARQRESSNLAAAEG